MSQNNILLPVLVFLPIVAGLVSWAAEGKNTRIPRWISLIGMIATLIISLYLWKQGDYSLSNAVAEQGSKPQWQAVFELPWMKSVGISFSLALDGLSLLLVILTAFLGVMAVGCSWGEIKSRVGFFYMNLLWSLGGVIGVFMAVDMFLFFFFWEMMLVPIYFLIALWGHSGSTGRSRIYAANKFFMYTQASGLVMLVGILMLVLSHYGQSGQITFSYDKLLGTTMSYEMEMAIMLCFFLAFAVKLPVVPLHGWLPDAHAQAPTAGSVDLAGILIKTAAYGLLRFALPLFPHATADFAPVAICLGIVGVFYGAILAFQQNDMKRLLAYTSISHMGFVLLGIYTGNMLTLQGVMVQMLAHGLSSAALFIMSGQIYERYHTRDLNKMGGMWGLFRYLSPFLLFFAAALCGIPGTGNFIGEFLILMGAFKSHYIASSLMALSMVFAGLYALIMLYKAMFGQPEQEHGHKDLTPREILLLGSLVIALVWLGLTPQTVLNTSERSLSWIQNSYVNPLFSDAPASGTSGTQTTGGAQ